MVIREKLLKLKKKYFNELQGENNYEKIFFIQYLFKPDLTSFSDTNLKITFDEFNQFMNEDINQFMIG